MKQKLVTPEADQAIADIFAFIATDNLDAAERYYRAAYDAFFELPDSVVPKRASEFLPEYVRALRVPNFDGYTLRIAILEDRIALLTALRPGASDDMTNDSTRQGLAGM
ncbi:type II toxin-antitoxin system RelE/ParE family toxin [uncultured Tateyamaria sp.]|uniref:type II toxin-antitoxin system RelE/ParE family toxin n=1 Tax=uncultured Tateyamaria sp. TaxID=455651 RepID=UPI002635BCB1|nr:type II toxin-antitoxin system RelE/ParE family toxin [uncultured Tateyamaria sp.]